MKIPKGLQFQIKISLIDLGSKIVPISKIGDFTLKYYIDDPEDYFVAYRQGVTMVNCEIIKDEIIVTHNYTYQNVGPLKCRMEFDLIDEVLPEEPFTFNCPEQRTEIEII